MTFSWFSGHPFANRALASTRRMVVTVLSFSLAAIGINALIAILSISGTQQVNFQRQTVAHRAQEIARILITSPDSWVDSILANAAEPDLTFTLERPAPDRRLYLEKTLAQYVSPKAAARLGDPNGPPADLAGEEYHPRAAPLLEARQALGLARGNLAYVLEGTGRDYWRVSIPVNDGKWLSVESKAVSVEQPGIPPRAFLFVAVTVAIALASIVALRRLTDPLHALEGAAIQLCRDLDAPPLPESGPRDVRRVAHAFNQMQSQLRRFVSDRTTMLAAISHDLRSPLQRLKFRADFMTDDEQREKMLRDLRDMEAMLAATLEFARADADREAVGQYDLCEIVNIIAADLLDCGYKVSLGAMPAALPYPCRGRALRRAIENLTANAANHGGAARLSVACDAATILIEIADDGPGLPPEELEKVFTPFYRPDVSRNRDTGGTGLGLAIARSIVREHGGDIVLINRPGGGLTAQLTLPD